MRRRALLAAILLAFAAPAAAQDAATVQKLADQFAEAFNKNGAAGIGDMYAEDAVLVPPQADIRMGRKDIQAFWTQQAKEAEGLTISVLDVKPLGPDAARAVVRGESTRKGQPPQHISGRNVVVLQKVGQDWKVTTHIWNYGFAPSQAALDRRSDDRESRRDIDRDRLRDRDSYVDRDRGDYRRDNESDRRGDRDERRYSDRDRDDYRPRRYEPYRDRGRDY